MFATLLFGLAPALHATRASVAGALKDEAPIRSARFSLRGLLLSAQVALSVVLLVAAALLLRSVSRVRAIDHGFDLDAVSVVALDAPAAAYDAQRTRVLAAELGGAMDGLGAAGPAAITQALPVRGRQHQGQLRVLHAGRWPRQRNRQR